LPKEEPIKYRIQAITAELRRYLERRLELFALEAGDQLSQLMAEFLFRIAGIMMLTGGILFGAVALAIYLGNLLGSESLGYLIVGVPILFLGLIIVSLRPAGLLRKMKNQMLDRMMEALPAKKPKMLPEKSSVRVDSDKVKSNGRARQHQTQNRNKN
jgi:hypothetical protein